jgi:hypothetical protein
MEPTPKNPDLTAKQKIELLAQEYYITYHQTYFDQLADTYARLSDCDVELDETQLLLLELDRAGILTGEANDSIHLQYLRERKSGSNILAIETAAEIEISASDSEFELGMAAYHRVVGKYNVIGKMTRLIRL